MPSFLELYWFGIVGQYWSVCSRYLPILLPENRKLEIFGTWSVAGTHSELAGTPHQSTARLPIPVFRNSFFGAQKQKKTGFLRISFLFLCFPEEVFTGTWFWRGRRNSSFWTPSQEFFTGIPVGHEFLYFLGFLRIPPDSCSRQKLSGLGQRLKKALC